MVAPRLVRLAGWLAVRLGCAIVGLAAGLAAVLVHQRWWGLLLGLAAAVAYALALPGGVARLAFTLGWAGAVVSGALQRPEGDFLVAADTAGYVLLFAAPALVLVAVATLVPGRRRPSPRDAAEPPSAAARLG